MGGWEVLEEVRSDSKLRRELAKTLAEDIALEIALQPELRKTITLKIIENAATKEDIKELKEYINTRIGDINKRIDSVNKRIDSVNKRIYDVNKRIDDLYGVVKASLIAITVTLASTIITPLILKLLGV